MTGDDQLHDSWTAFEADIQRRSDAQLHGRELPELNSVFTKLGPIGQSFLDAFNASACRETVDRSMHGTTTNAALTTHNFGRGVFVNTLSYNPSILHNLHLKFLAKAHDGIHAIQWATSAANHARAWNSKSKMVLCPRDDLLLLELSERDAYAKQLLLERLRDHLAPLPQALQPHPQSHGHADARPLLFPGNKTSFEIAEPLERALQVYAATVLESEKLRNGTSFVTHYRALALSDWHSGHTLRCHEQDIEFVRLDTEDILQIGTSLGIHSLGRTGADALTWLQQPLDPHFENRVADLNQKAGIENDRELRTLNDALSARGLSKEDFLQLSRDIQVQPPVSGP